MSPNVHQTSHELLREVLGGALAAAVDSRCDGGIDSTPCRAIAALYALLGAHPIDCADSVNGRASRPGIAAPRRRRTIAFAGASSAEHDLAERGEEIMRTELGHE